MDSIASTTPALLKRQDQALSEQPKKTKVQQDYEALCQMERALNSSEKVRALERLKFVQIFDEFMLRDVKAAIKYDFDNRKWKTSVYTLISKNRNRFSRLSGEEVAEWNAYLDNVLDKYKELQEKLIGNKVWKPIWARIPLHMADIYRYKALYFKPTDKKDMAHLWRVCVKSYLDHANFGPSNGHAWSQLAVVSTLTGLHLKAIMYYIRSLCVSKPFPSAKETILESLQVGLDHKADASMILPGVVNSSIHLTEGLFLKLIRMIYTKIEVGDFQSQLTKLTLSLNPCLEALCKLPREQQFNWWFTIAVTTIGASYLAINNEAHDPVVKELLFTHSIDMIFIWITFCISKAEDNEPLQMFLQIMMTWLAKCEIKNYANKFGLVCVAWCELFYPQYLTIPEEEYFKSIFNTTQGIPEDCLLAGFLPLEEIGSVELASDNVLNFKFEKSENRARRISLLLGYIIKQYKYYLQSQPDQDQPVVQSEEKVSPKSNSAKTPTSGTKEYAFEDLHDDADLEREPGNFISDLLDVQSSDEELEKLRDRKTNLATLKLKDKDKSVDLTQASLLFDTNCYLSSLRDIVYLTEKGKRKVVIPLAVLNELDGLSKNAAKSANATVALDYINSNFKNPNLSVVTISGSKLTSLDFRHEDWGLISTADDIIVATAKNIGDVCLVTNDINMRAKARNLGIPVVESVKQLRQ